MEGIRAKLCRVLTTRVEPGPGSADLRLGLSRRACSENRACRDVTTLSGRALASTAQIP
jgi:hypothetical protein